ncbi:unnamed protein product [Brassica oleracea]
MIRSHPEFSCNQLTAMEALHSLSAIRHWSPLYKATINHLKQDPTNRQTFLFFKDDENKVLYLEFATVVLTLQKLAVMDNNEILRLLVEDDELDLLFDENQHMYTLVEEMFGVPEADTNRQSVRTNRGEGWRRVQRFMNGSEVQCYEILRMNQETFKSLCKMLSEKSAWSRDGKCGWASCGQRTCVQGRPGQESCVVEKCGWVKCGWANRGRVKNVSGMRRVVEALRTPLSMVAEKVFKIKKKEERRRKWYRRRSSTKK